MPKRISKYNIGDIWRWSRPDHSESESLLLISKGYAPDIFDVLILENGERVDNVRMGLGYFTWEKIA